MTQIAREMMQRETTQQLLQDPALIDTQFALTEDQKKIVAQKIGERTWYLASTIGKKEGGHTKQVNKVIWTLDGTHLISCSSDKTIKLFDINTKQCVYTWDHTNGGFNEKVFTISLSNDGKLLAAGSKSAKYLKLYDLTSRNCINSISELDGGVGVIKWSDDNAKLIVISNPWIETTYSVPNLQTIIEPHTIDWRTVEGLNWGDASHDRTYHCMRSDDTLFIYGCKEKLPLAYYYSSADSNVTSAYFSPDGRFIASSWADHAIKLFTHANSQNIMHALECLKHARENERGSAFSLICKALPQHDEQ